MKKRPKYFLASDKIDQEIFDYIQELHNYLWRFVRYVYPGTMGNLGDHLDDAINELEQSQEAK